MEQRKTIMEKITDRVIYGNDTSWNMKGSHPVGTDHRTTRHTG